MLLISASRVATITGVNHWYLALWSFFEWSVEAKSEVILALYKGKSQRNKGKIWPKQR
jgi:hypothetical protein